MIIEPPLLDGAAHERLICVPDVGVAVRPSGGAGEDEVDPTIGVAEASGEAVLGPNELIAYTLYAYVVPVVSPVWE